MASSEEWNESVINDTRGGGARDITVRSITELKTEPKRLFDSILFDGMTIIRCMSGSFRFLFKDRPEIILQEGEALVVYPRHIITVDALGRENRLVYGIFDGSDVISYFDSLGFFDCAQGHTEAHYESIMALRRQLESVLSSSRASASNTDAGLASCFSILTDILATQAKELRRNNPIVFDAVRLIHHNLRHRIVRMKNLCDQLGISRVHLHRLFVKAGLGSPSDYIRGKQLHYVRDMLENTNLAMFDVAERAGFISPAHFATFVKRMTGMTPTQVRKGGLSR